jgi:hypothetical protein
MFCTLESCHKIPECSARRSKAHSAKFPHSFQRALASDLVRLQKIATMRAN